MKARGHEMAIKSLRSRPRPDNLKNQPRTSQSLARRIYLASLLLGGGWIGLQVFGPLVFLDADGMIMQDHKVVGADYTAQVLSMTAVPGDGVAAGQRIATFHLNSNARCSIGPDIARGASEL